MISRQVVTINLFPPKKKLQDDDYEEVINYPVDLRKIVQVSSRPISRIDWWALFRSSSVDVDSE